MKNRLTGGQNFRVFRFSKTPKNHQKCQFSGFPKTDNYFPQNRRKRRFLGLSRQFLSQNWSFKGQFWSGPFSRHGPKARAEQLLLFAEQNLLCKAKLLYTKQKLLCNSLYRASAEQISSEICSAECKAFYRGTVQARRRLSLRPWRSVRHYDNRSSEVATGSESRYLNIN